MPGKVGVKIKAGRNLPIMDRTNETTDAYVEIKLGTVTHKTDVCRKSLNPQWNTDWFRFELDDAELQDEPLQIRLMDHDTYSANDAIGKVNISLNPLCLDLGKGAVISGWLPVFDTMHGIRGEVFVTVKVDLFSDANKFRQSSCGVQFFHSPCVPHGYRAQVIHGFVEELVVNDDPEYQWIDKIRTPRASNEARQVVFQKLSGQVQRKMGLKAINLGANAVTGFKFCFDLEGDVGVVARGIGTAVSLVKIQETPLISQDNALIEESSSELVPAVAPTSEDRTTASPAKQHILPAGHARTESLSMKMSQSPKVGGDGSNNNSLTNKDINNGVCRRSSDSDLSITPKGNSICVASERLVQATALMKLNQNPILKPTTEMEMLEYPFLTMCKFPPGFILHLGSTVAARSVKLLERVPNPDEPEIRDSWWTELRMEIRSHARALGCNVVLGYSEETTISDDVCVLSATGTAAVINMSYNMESSQNDLSTNGKMVFSLDEKDMFKENKNTENAITKDMSSSYSGPTRMPSIQSTTSGCVLSHVPYNPVTVPFSCKLKKCAICKKARVPDVLLATIELPESLLITGRGCLLQAQVLRAKKDLRSESNAKEISDGLPFLEYELHRLLINKLKAKGMNAIFGLKVQVTIGEKMMALVATGTAVYLSSLPPPSVPKIVAGNSWTDKVRLIELQKCLQETFERNREIYQLKNLDPDCASIKQQSDTDDSDDDLQDMDLNTGNKDTCVLEVDDIEDLEIISLLIESCPPEGFHVVNTQNVPGLQDLEVVRNLQMFTQVWRAKLNVGQNSSVFPKHFHRLLQTIYFKLRCMVPCAICDLQFKLELPESDEIQVLVTGMALGLGEPMKIPKFRKKTNSDCSQSGGVNGKKSTDDDLIFSLDEDQNMDGSYNAGSGGVNYGAHSLKLRKNSPSRTKFSSMRLSRHLPLRERYGVDITPLSYVPGGKIDKYLGNLNFFFIRETTSIKEIGGISGFVHGFITELLAIVRAHITALGGNAIVSFYMTELILVDNQHKNQGQCLISIGGDVVNVSYFPDD